MGEEQFYIISIIGWLLVVITAFKCDPNREE
jgi:hypothetical protein